MVGEEKETKLWPVDAARLLPITSSPLFASELLAGKGPAAEELPLDELCVWVDPLDGTLDFVNGLLSGVTVLVGVARKGRPELSLIGSPYQLAAERHEFRPCVTVARAGCDRFLALEGGAVTQAAVVRYPINYESLRVGVSTIRANEHAKQIISKMGGEPVKMGGFGRKTLELFHGRIDAFLYANRKSSRWDSICAEVMVGLVGGVTVNF